MKQGKRQVAVVLEVGRKRVFAIARDWPGWCRSGPNERAALQALLDHAPRYQRVLKAIKIRFASPKQPAELEIVERLKGDATTDFGAPSMAWADDQRPISPRELKRFQRILQACWLEFDGTVETARGKALRKGPRAGIRWTPRYFVRRLAWHELDHAWEIEGRAETPAL